MGKILVVDDEPAVDQLMRQIFRKEIRMGEYQLAFAEDGEAALKLLAEDPQYDVILSDINMPGMDGLTLLSHIHGDHPLIKVVMISAYNDPIKIKEAQKYGAYEFINKPIGVLNVKDVVQRAIAIGRGADPQPS